MFVEFPVFLVPIASGSLQEPEAKQKRSELQIIIKTYHIYKIIKKKLLTKQTCDKKNVITVVNTWWMRSIYPTAQFLSNVM